MIIQYNDIAALKRAVTPINLELRPAAPYDTHTGVIASVLHQGEVVVSPLNVASNAHLFNAILDVVMALAGTVGLDLELEIEGDPSHVAPVAAPVESTPAPVLEEVAKMTEPVVVVDAPVAPVEAPVAPVAVEAPVVAEAPVAPVTP